MDTKKISNGIRVGAGSLCAIFAPIAIAVGFFATVGNLTLDQSLIVEDTSKHIINSIGLLAMGGALAMGSYSLLKPR